MIEKYGLFALICYKVPEGNNAQHLNFPPRNKRLLLPTPHQTVRGDHSATAIVKMTLDVEVITEL